MYSIIVYHSFWLTEKEKEFFTIMQYVYSNKKNIIELILYRVKSMEVALTTCV